MAGGGNTFAVLEGIGYWAMPGTVIPGPHIPYGGSMPTGWYPIVDTVNGYQVTFRNPRAAITSEERGRIGQVPAGDEGMAIALQFRSIDFDLLKKISAIQTRTLAARIQVSVLTITGTATAPGTALVNPGGLSSPVSIAIANGDTAAVAAASVAAGTYAGYTDVAATNVVTFTAAEAGSKGTPTITGLPAGLTATFVSTTRGIGETEVGELDKNVDMNFMLCVEGKATAGSFFEEERWIRYVMYNVENTANADHILRHSGADAAFAPNATLEALPIPSGYTSAYLDGSGLVADDLDKNKRGNFFAIDAGLAA